MTNKPTDAELIAFAVETGMRARTGKGVVSFARAVLTKWGQPAHSGEPVECDCRNPYSHDECTQQAGCKIKTKLSRKTHQPVKREPLTREQVKAICVESGYETATLQERADFINGMMHAERHHGIKGGQHGDAKPYW